MRRLLSDNDLFITTIFNHVRITSFLSYNTDNLVLFPVFKQDLVSIIPHRSVLRILSPIRIIFDKFYVCQFFYGNPNLLGCPLFACLSCGDWTGSRSGMLC